MRAGTGLTASLKHRDFRLLISAATLSITGSWAYNVALVVWIYEQTGSAAWVGASTVFRFVPALLFSPYSGVIAERFERVRLLVTLDSLAFVTMSALAIETALDVPVAVAVATAAATSTIGTAYEPAVAAMTPLLVGERDLGSANALRNSIDNICVIAGPGIGAVILLLGPAPIAIGLNALTFLGSAALVSRIRTRSQPVDVTEGGELSTLRQMTVGIRAIVSSATASVLVVACLIATFAFGADSVLLVLFSRDIFETGSEGYGYLLAGLGAGGVLAAAVVTRLERLPRLGLVILIFTVSYCLPTLAFLVLSSPVVGFATEVVRGFGSVVVDVLAVTALQRALPRELLGRVFGAFGSLSLLAVIVGAVVAPPIVAAVGLDGAIWVFSAGVPALCLLGLPALTTMDRASVARREALAPKVRLLADCDLFSATSEGAIEELAGTAQTELVPAGHTVVTEGEPADDFYVVVSGRLSVASEGEGQQVPLADLGAGDFFGEIGLIEEIPRTATVTTRTDSELLRIGGAALIAALTEATPSSALLDGASSRLRRTHPSRQLTRAALAATEDGEKA